MIEGWKIAEALKSDSVQGMFVLDKIMKFPNAMTAFEFFCLTNQKEIGSFYAQKLFCQSYGFGFGKEFSLAVMGRKGVLATGQPVEVSVAYCFWYIQNFNNDSVSEMSFRPDGTLEIFCV